MDNALCGAVIHVLYLFKYIKIKNIRLHISFSFLDITYLHLRRNRKDLSEFKIYAKVDIFVDRPIKQISINPGLVFAYLCIVTP